MAGVPMQQIRLNKYGNFDHESKERVLVLFKNPERWNEHVLDILSTEYSLVHGYFGEIFAGLGTRQLLELVKKVRNDFGIISVLIDPEWCDTCNVSVIKRLDEIVPVGLMLFDDNTMHDYNLIVGSAASYVLCGCPMGVYRYRSFDITTEYFVPISSRVYDVEEQPPEFDVSWFGFPNKADRQVYIQALREQRRFTTDIHTGETHGDKSMSGDISFRELAERIKRSRISVNLSRSDFPMRCWPYHGMPRAEMYQVSGRIIEVGLSGRLCVSQYSPCHELLGFSGYLREFETPEGMLSLLSDLLRGDLASETRRYVDFTREKFGAHVLAENARRAIDQSLKSSDRYPTRVTQTYYQIAAGALQRTFANNPALRDEELALLNEVCSMVQLDFKGSDGQRLSGRKIPIMRPVPRQRHGA